MKYLLTLLLLCGCVPGIDDGKNDRTPPMPPMPVGLNTTPRTAIVRSAVAPPPSRNYTNTLKWQHPWEERFITAFNIYGSQDVTKVRQSPLFQVSGTNRTVQVVSSNSLFFYAVSAVRK